MTPTTVLWIYIILLVLGGMAGFLKAKSKVSLYTSIGFAAALSLPAAGIVPFQAAIWLQAALLIVFAIRLVKTKRFMPAGLMLVLTIVALALENLV